MLTRRSFLICSSLASLAVITPPTFADAPHRLTQADLDAMATRLRPQVPKGYTVVTEAPFVVVGNDQPARVRRHATGIVRWTVDHLRRMYFPHDPEKVVIIWLFKDAQSYQTFLRTRYNEDPGTPFGYYSPEHQAIFMNMATGGGTLVHEIVHPFMEKNFPACPAWFNEGLASLYEQSAERAGRMVGLTNWRLEGLQQAIRDNNLPSFEFLTATSTDDFYVRDPGTHYAQARYLCYYLQEKGLLQRYYASFHNNAASDPTGFKTLKTVLGRDDMVAFQREWQRYVLKLRFP